MRRFVLLAVLFGLAAPALAQEHYNEGPVWRVTYYNVKPGKFNETLADLRANFGKVMAAAKAQGVVQDYKVFLNSTSDSADDWDIATATLYKGYGGMDGLAAKMDAITLLHYGTADARRAAGEKRDQLRDVVMSKLAREITLKP
ncbi:MAG: hypothetical protein ACRD3M_04820 [Thermoanaerobaculia bacterium]